MNVRPWLWLVLFVACVGDLVAEEKTPVRLDAGSLQISFSSAGHLQGLTDSARNRDYFVAGRPAPLLTLRLAGKDQLPTSLTYDRAKRQIQLAYGSTAVTAVVRVAMKPTHVTFELVSVVGGTPTQARWGPFPTTVGKTVGNIIGVVRDERFALGIQSLDVRTDAGAVRKEPGSELWARVIEQDGVIGSKIALFGCPSHAALATIGEIEVAEGLPHPMLDGVWGKVSPTARCSYLIISLAENKMDEILELARKGGFKYVYDPNPFKSWGRYVLDPARFPDGDASMRRCVEKAAKYGIRLGGHTLTSFITTNDPYVTPVPDPRLARLGSTTLSAAIDAQTTEIPVSDPAPFRKTQNWGWSIPTAILGTEIVQYESISQAAPWTLRSCKRGALGTRAAAHPAQADIGRLATHGYKTLYPGIDNGMADEMAARLTQLINTTGMRQLSFDGLEGLWDYGHGQSAAVGFVKRSSDGWKHEVRSDASGLLHYLWHVHSHMNWGELTLSAKQDVDNYRVKNCQMFEDNLFPTALGWWRLNGAGSDWEATRIEDIEYLVAKAAGWNGLHALATDLAVFRRHGYAHQCLEMIRHWDEAKQRGAFTDSQRALLRQPGRDFHLDPAGADRWNLTEVKYSPFYWMCPGTGRAQPADSARHVLSFTTAGPQHLEMNCPTNNPFDRQPIRFELRTLGSLDYADSANIDLTPSAPTDWRREVDLHKDAPELQVKRAEVAGCKGYEIRTSYQGKAKLSWVTRVVASLPKPLDLRQHRGLGFWVRGDGKGELLFMELVAGDCKRQYYVPIDFTGERYFEFPLGEMCLGRYYAYDWNHWSGFASWWVTLKGFPYNHVDRITLGFNAIPAGSEVTCAVAGLKALRESGSGLKDPILELRDQKMSFADTLPPGSYLIYEGGKKAELRDANLRLLREVPFSGSPLTLETGENKIHLSYSGSQGRAPWARFEGKCVGPRQEVVAK